MEMVAVMAVAVVVVLSEKGHGEKTTVEEAELEVAVVAVGGEVN